MSDKNLTVVRLKKNREASVARHHPWVFSGAIDKLVGNVESGDLVRVVDSGNQLLGIGAYSASSQIRIRMLNFNGEDINRNFYAKKISHALTKRKSLLESPNRTACRLIYGESDQLPGLIVDKYQDTLVCQFLFAGIEPRKAEIVSILAEQSGCKNIFERSDTNSRDKEGLPQTTGVLWGAEPQLIRINENGMLFDVDVVAGQKTGFFLDQTENRKFVNENSSGKNVLNCFSYTGGFTVAALLGEANHVTSIDSSAPALELLQKNLGLNGINASKHTSLNGNVFHVLRDFQSSGRTFELIILDPPKFAENKNQVTKAARAYKDLALQACKLLSPGGMLVTFSCSGSIDMNLFQKITSDALLDAQRQGEIVHYLHQGQDHPIALEFPESQYLKGLACRVY